MTHKITSVKTIILAGIDFFGKPFDKAGGWSEENEIGKLWKRFNGFYERNKDSIKNKVSESGYELWAEFDGEAENHYIFVGVEVEKAEEPPLELVIKILPSTRYAIFTLRGEEFKCDWGSKISNNWLPSAGLRQSHNFIIECYDSERFRGPNDPESELDIYVPVE